MGICVAVDCTNIGSFHFPKCPKLKSQWLHKIKRANFKPSKHSRVCAEHFTKDCFVHSESFYKSFGLKMRRLLKKGAVPTIFAHNKPAKRRQSVIEKLEQQKLVEAALQSHEIAIMPGANCSFFGCPVSRGKKWRALSLFKIPNPTTHPEWHKNIKSILCRTRDKAKFNIKTAHVCSRHFEDSCFRVGESGRVTLIVGSLPTRNLPKKSFDKDVVIRPGPGERKLKSLPLKHFVNGQSSKENPNLLRSACGTTPAKRLYEAHSLLKPPQKKQCMIPTDSIRSETTVKGGIETSEVLDVVIKTEITDPEENQDTKNGVFEIFEAHDVTDEEESQDVSNETAEIFEKTIQNENQVASNELLDITETHDVTNEKESQNSAAGVAEIPIINNAALQKENKDTTNKIVNQYGPLCYYVPLKTDANFQVGNKDAPNKLVTQPNQICYLIPTNSNNTIQGNNGQANRNDATTQKMLALLVENKVLKQQLKTRKDELSEKLVEQTLKIDFLKKRLSLISSELEENLRQNKFLTKFTVDGIKDDPKKFMYYTGLTYDNFKTLFAFLVPDECNRPLEFQKPHFKAMSLQNQLLLTLIKLRLNFDFSHLGTLFNIKSARSVENIFKNWISYMFGQYKSSLKWPHRREIVQNMPANLQKYFPNLMIILKKTTIQLLEPRNLPSKSCQSLKGLIGLDPSGTFMYISPLVSGATPDEELAEKCSLFTDLKQHLDNGRLEKGDAVLVKDNVPIREGIEKLGLKLRNSKENSRIEQFILQAKQFRIVDNKIEQNLIPCVNQIWFCCCFLSSSIPWNKET